MGPRPLLRLARGLPRNNLLPPHMYYHVKFGRSVLKGVNINTEEPSNWGPLESAFLGRGVADHLKPSNSPHVLSRQIR